MLLKRIQNLKNDKEQLALKYEQEEERLTNDLMRKLTQVFLLFCLALIFFLSLFFHRLLQLQSQDVRVMTPQVWMGLKQLCRLTHSYNL